MNHQIVNNKIIVNNNINKLLYDDKKVILMACCNELEMVEKFYNLNELYLCDIWKINCIHLRYYNYINNYSFDNFYHSIINYSYYYNEDDNCYYYCSDEIFLELDSMYNDTIFYYEDDNAYFYCSVMDFDYACEISYNGNNINLSCVKETEYLDNIFMELYSFYEYLYSFILDDLNENNVHDMFNFLEPYLLCLKPYFDFFFFLSSFFFGGTYHELKKKDVYSIVNMIKEQSKFYEKISVEEHDILNFKLWFKKFKCFMNKFKFEVFDFYRRRYPLYFYNIKFFEQRKHERFLAGKRRSEKDFQKMISRVYAYDLFEIARIYKMYDIEIIEDLDRFGDDFYRKYWKLYERSRYKDEF